MYTFKDGRSIDTEKKPRLPPLPKIEKIHIVMKKN